MLFLTLQWILKIVKPFYFYQNFLLFRAMREADKKRERLLNCRQKAAAASARGESKETKKIRDSNTTTLMLIVVITVVFKISAIQLLFHLTQKGQDMKNTTKAISQ